MPKAMRTRAMTRTDCQHRAATAKEHLAVARERSQVADTRPGPSGTAQVAASNAVLAAIAAADAICGSVLGECSNEQDHRTATSLLKRVPGGEVLATKLHRLLADKTALQYGGFCTDAVARTSISQATALVQALDSYDL